jgi:maltokinase
MAAADAAWLLAQRWFRSKQRPIARVAVVDRASVDTGTELRIVEVTYADGGEPDRYLVPTVDGREPEDGEGAWRAIVGAMAADAQLPATSGRFSARHTEALGPLAATPLAERRLGVEQSNTSVRIGEGLILKLYRLLEPGLNPDLEVSAFLARAGFADTPALAGAMTWDPVGGEPSAAAMLQAFVPSIGDGWATTLQALREQPEAATGLAHEVGALTRRLHDALASAPSDAFPARAATAADTAAWRASAERQLAQAVTAVSGDSHRELVELAPALRARFADTFGAATGAATVSRVHGDLHLGQLLRRQDGGFSVIDFEGEPARPLAERRAPSSPLRDVAGLLRSLDYAARTVERENGALDAEGWLRDGRAALLAGYGGIGPDEGPLLDAFELEKACYEVRYEAGNRPEWLWLPLAALRRLAAL